MKRSWIIFFMLFAGYVYAQKPVETQLVYKMVGENAVFMGEMLCAFIVDNDKIKANLGGTEDLFIIQNVEDVSEFFEEGGIAFHCVNKAGVAVTIAFATKQDLVIVIFSARGMDYLFVGHL